MLPPMLKFLGREGNKGLLLEDGVEEDFADFLGACSMEINESK